MDKRTKDSIERWDEIRNTAKQEPAQCVRILLDRAVGKAQLSLNKAQDDHRYSQGRLHALEEFLSSITR